MSDFLCCWFCNGSVSVNRDRPTRQGSVSLQGVGHFCSRSCARIYVTLKPTKDFAPDSVFTFSNPPLAFRVMEMKRTPDGITFVTIGESNNDSHAIRMASAYPLRAIVTNLHSKRVFDNGKEMSGAAVA